jgi:hypothetical protein
MGKYVQNDEVPANLVTLHFQFLGVFDFCVMLHLRPTQK